MPKRGKSTAAKSIRHGGPDFRTISIEGSSSKFAVALPHSGLVYGGKSLILFRGAICISFPFGWGAIPCFQKNKVRDVA